VTSTKTVLSTKTEIVPYRSQTHTVICSTKPVWVWTQSTKLYSTSQTKPYTTESLSTATSTTEVAKTYTTTVAQPKTVTSIFQQSSTQYHTSTGSKCAPETKCTTSTAGWGYNKGY